MAKMNGKWTGRAQSVAMVLATVIGTAGMAQAATVATWNGNGSDANWSTGANWGGSVPAAESILAFGGTKNLASNNDLAEGTSFDGINFNTNAGAFTLGGNGIVIPATTPNGIFNLYDLTAANPQTINLNISSTAGVSLISRVVAGGNLTLGGTISGNLGFQVYYDSGNNAGGTTKISGTLHVNSINNRGGTLVLTNTSAATISGTVNVGVGSNFASTLDIQGGTHSFNSVQIGSGTSTLATATQEAGTVNVAGFFSGYTGLSTNAGPNSYTITGGTLNLNNTYVGGASGTGAGNSGWLMLVKGGTVNMNQSSGGYQYVANTSNGTLQIDSGLVNQAASSSFLAMAVAKGAANGVIQLNGGTLKAYGLTVDALTTGTAVINFNGGTLQTAHSGNDANFINGLTAANVQHGGAIIDTNGATITISQNLLSDPGTGNTKDGGLTKLGSGSLELSGSGNTYNGNTSVQAGTLKIDTIFLADDGTVSLANGAIMNLNFTGTDTVGSLVLDGVTQAAGVYGAGALGSSYFTGTGTITVAAVPEPAALGFLIIGGLSLLTKRHQKAT